MGGGTPRAGPVVEPTLGGVAALAWEGLTAGELASRWRVPRVVLFAEVDSTMDVAHALAADGAPAGTVVIAEVQRAGRGRAGHRWSTASGTTLAVSLIERPTDPKAIGVLSLRLGLLLAMALHRQFPDLRVKWPNDLMRPDGKVGGVLVEARWRGAQPDWVAIGVGLNVSASPWPGASSLAFDGSRADIMTAVVASVRAAAASEGQLTRNERESWRAHDWALGRRVIAPVRGIARGVEEDGSLIVDAPAGPVRCASGSLILDAE